MEQPRKGDRVRTPLGAGTVAYVRFGWPHFRLVDTVSVILDAKRQAPGYSGTVFRAEDVLSEGARP